jgi:hypothetical protein
LFRRDVSDVGDYTDDLPVAICESHLADGVFARP